MPNGVTDKSQSATQAQQQQAWTKEEFDAAFDYADKNGDGKIGSATERMHFMEKVGGGYKSNNAFRANLGIDVTGLEGTTSKDLAQFYGKEGFTKTQIWDDYQKRQGIAGGERAETATAPEASKAQGND